MMNMRLLGKYGQIQKIFKVCQTCLFYDENINRGQALAREHWMIIDAAELKRRYLQRIAGVRDRQVYIGPEVVTLDINNSCNLSCRYCWIHAPGNPAHFEKAHFFSMGKIP